MKWHVEIPRPKAKRMAVEPKLITITEIDPWGRGTERSVEIPADQWEAVVDAPDGLMLRDPNVLDGNYLVIAVEFRNYDSTRREVIDLEPVPAEECDWCHEPKRLIYGFDDGYHPPCDVCSYCAQCMAQEI